MSATLREQRVRAERRVAVGAEPRLAGALGRHARRGVGIRERRERRGERIAAPRLDRERALPHRGHEPQRIDPLGDPIGEPEPIEPRAREHHRVEPLALELREPRRHVPAQRHDLADRGAGGSSCALRRALPVPTRAPRGRSSSRATPRRHERIARIRALRERREHELGRRFAGQILGAVHGDVGPPVEQRLFDLLHEQALAADFGERHVAQLVAASS